MTLSYQYYFVSKYLFKLRLISHSIKPIVSAILMGMVIILFKNINLFLLINISAALYFLLLISFKTFLPRDMNHIQKLFKKEKGIALLQ